MRPYYSEAGYEDKPRVRHLQGRHGPTDPGVQDPDPVLTDEMAVIAMGLHAYGTTSPRRRVAKKVQKAADRGNGGALRAGAARRLPLYAKNGSWTSSTCPSAASWR